ncbi:MAG: ferritin family protein [Vulcanimicrobiaceae bacterium]
MLATRTRARTRRFEDLSDLEILAIAINNEEEAARTYRSFADSLQSGFPDSARLFTEMAAEETEHHARLMKLFTANFGGTIPALSAKDVHGVAHEHPAHARKPSGAQAMRRRAQAMEVDASRFYRQAAERIADPKIREVFSELAETEAAHEQTAGDFDPHAPPSKGRAQETEAERRQFILQIIQPGLVGLMDGSVSTLAPVFAAAFATHNPWNAFLVGIAASLGAGISMGFAEALSDDGKISGRGAPLLRGAICGAMTFAGGIGHTLPFLIPHFLTAVIVAAGVAAIELLTIAWIQWRFMAMAPLAAAAKVMFGGAIVLAVGILIGSS